jgi:uncharacterized protein
MIIKLYDMQEALVVRGTLEGLKFKRPEDAEVSFLSPIRYELIVTKTGDNLWLRGPVHADLSLSCSRCLESFAYSIDSELSIELMPKEAEPSGSEVELKNDELDIYYYEGDEIDLDPYVYEEVMLGIPLKALCSDSCKGMCPVCGKNLNVETCRCEKIGTTVLGEKLKSFLKKQ